MYAQVKSSYHRNSKHWEAFCGIEMCASSSGESIPDLSGYFAFQIRQVLSWSGNVSDF